jgi:alkylhydroperoxidase family enzyme
MIGDGRNPACHAGFACGAAKSGLIVVPAAFGSNFGPSGDRDEHQGNEEQARPDLPGSRCYGRPVQDPEAPRIAPGGFRDIGLRNWAIVQGAGLVSGGKPPNVLTTIARHRKLFRRWLKLGSALMPGGKLPRDEVELMILRVAHNSGSGYEWSQHERIAGAVGLSGEEIERVRDGAEAPGWSERQATMLAAVDALHADRRIGEELWVRLRSFLDEEELIELCLLVGHYEGLAMTLNSLAVELDPLPERPPLALRLLAKRRPA